MSTELNEKEPVCAFTGHRSIREAHRGILEDLVRRAVDYAYGKGVRVFLAGGAVGFDTVAAAQVILYKISHPDVRLELCIPCADQSEGWSNAERDRYEFIMARADSVEILSDRYFKGCMKNRNARLVERADMLISYADVKKSFSGTMQTVRMAKEKGIEVYNLFPTLERTK